MLDEISSRSTSGQFKKGAAVETAPEAALFDQGVFCHLLLEPEHDPLRYKVGFATSLPESLRQLRCSAPFTTVVRSWPCKRLWEKTAIDCVTEACDRLHTEVFRASSIEEVEAKRGQFFALMPKLTNSNASSATEKLEAMAGVELLRKEAELGRKEDFEHYLEAVPDVLPLSNDIVDK